MIHKPEKDEIYREVIARGAGHPNDMPQLSAQQTGWLTKFLQCPKKFAATRRYVNRFKLGADPEFCFGNGPNRMEASGLGLMQGPAFGADNNGRLAEIRPYPSRSAVEVVASILTTLRWMAVLYPPTLDYSWHAGAYLWDDGIGGHVHFGRKRPNRRQEVTALDSIEEALLNLDAYPKTQVLRRRQGDIRRQIYGALGDFRLQKHGYEYRTFPSWLDSPELAFVTLVLSKLAVQMPDLFRFRAISPHIELNRLRNFLAYFKQVDDDARLALVLLDRGLPRHAGGDFKSRWGITKETATGLSVPQIGIVPPCIKPDRQSIAEVWSKLRDGKPLGFRVPEVNWTPTAPPAKYTMCINLTNTILQKGLGEMIWDICCSDNKAIAIVSGHREETVPIGISKDLIAMFPSDWRKRFNNRAKVSDLRMQTVSIAPHWREGARAGEVRRLLLNGLLPLWKVQDCKLDSYIKWQTKSKAGKKGRLIGKVVFESTSHKFGPLAGT